LNPGELFDTALDGAGEEAGNSTLINGNEHAVRGVTSGLIEVGENYGYEGSSLEVEFNTNHGDHDAGWIVAVDNVQLVVPPPGDVDGDGKVCFSDAFTVVNNYGVMDLDEGNRWASGDFDFDHRVGFSDAFSLVNNYGMDLTGAPEGCAALLGAAGGSHDDGVTSLVYDRDIGLLSIEADDGVLLKSLEIVIEWGAAFSFIDLPAFDPGGNAWGATFVENELDRVGFATLTAFGGTFLPGDGFVIGECLDPGLPLADLEMFLTIRYGMEGSVGTFTGDLIYIPEPCTLLLLGAGGLLLSCRLARRRRQA
ncbi:MAG: PEP-CTERM sorting domain-containing protein, partial [Phycisphaerae bacterium]